MMKIVIISKSFSKGGAASGARNLRKALDNAGAEVISYDSMCLEVSIVKKLIRVVERVFDRLFFDPETHCFRFFKESLDLMEVYNRHKPDIIQLCDISGNLVDLRKACEVPCPVVHRLSDFWPYHGASHYSLSADKGSVLANGFFSFFINQPKPRSLYHITPSEWLRDSLITDSSAGRFFIPNAVQLQVTELPKYRNSQDFLTLGFISNIVLDPRKGFLKLVEVLGAASLEGLNIRLVVYGNIKDQAKVYSECFDIFYKGSFSSEDLKAVYESFDVLLCPSLLDNSPNVVTEALSHGCPVIGQIGTGMASYISSDFGGLLDFWGSNRVGSDFRSLAKRIESEYEIMSERAKDYVHETLSPRVVGEKYLEIYKMLISNFKRGNGNA